MENLKTNLKKWDKPVIKTELSIENTMYNFRKFTPLLDGSGGGL